MDRIAPRILLYSHDSFGLGHLRRSLTIAQRLTERIPGASAIVATGSPCATHFDPPKGVEVVKLPSVGKDESGRYVPRAACHETKSIARLRRSLLDAVWSEYRPDLFVVDHRPTGLWDEVHGLLRRSRMTRTRTVLGVRDVIDAPERVATEWGRDEVRWALAEGYDRVCVYGSESVFDTRAAYPFPPELGERLEYVGYVVRDDARVGPAPIPEIDPEVVVTTGGGEDGERRIAAYLDALRIAPAPWQSTIVLGPMLTADAERRLRLGGRGLPRLSWHRFVGDLPKRMARADAVVAMAGYNTTAELLAARQHAVLVPRTEPRREQLIRARALEDLGLATVASADDPYGLRRAIDTVIARHGTDHRSSDAFRTVSLDGVDGMTRVAQELLVLDAGDRLAEVGS